jgi:hypothetical protein
MLGKHIKIIPFWLNRWIQKMDRYSIKIKFMRLYHAFCLQEKEHIVLQFESAEICLRKLLKQGFDLGVKNEAILYSVVCADQNSTSERINFSPSDISNSEPSLSAPTFA